MNSPATDLARYLESKGVGSLGLGSTSPGAGVGIFVAEEPPEPSESVTLYAYAGERDDTLQGAPLDFFRLQVRARARDYASAWTLAALVESFLDRLAFSLPDGAQSVKYVRILRDAPPSELGKDEKHRQIFTQNFSVMRQLI
jgi:hypothetical protein